jgi:FtsH-binding integral membrane protein
VCSVSEPQLVLIAAVMTLGITASLTYYAMTTKTDFTMMGASLFIFGMALMLFGIIVGLFQSRVMHVVYCSFGVILYGFYLVYDVQLLVGGRG